MRLESVVLMFYPMWEEKNPCVFKILEIYANEQSYQKHLQTPHFKKYKQGTSKMVKNLELIDMKALNPQIFLKKDLK